MSNLFSALTEAWTGRGSDVFALLPGGRTWTFDELLERTEHIAAALMARGAGPGDRVMAQLPKAPEVLALYLATLRIGAVYMPLNPAYTDAETDHFAGDAQPTLIVGGSRAHCALEALLDHPDRSTGICDCAPGEPAALLYTSGTTGVPKGVLISHRNLLVNARALTDLWQFTAGDVLIHALPLFHIHGLFVATHCALMGGSKIRFLPRFEAAEVIQALRSGSTTLMGVPTFYARLLAERDFGAADCRHARLFISGSAPMSEELHARWQARTGHAVLERYGMTETGIITSNPYAGTRVPGSVGFALPGMQIRVADTDHVPVAPGQSGMIEVRGEHVFAGYRDNPDANTQAFTDDGYFVTGDIGTMDAEGRLSIAGRAKDVIISGGFNLYPREIEEALETLHGVNAAAVIGVPDDDLGEIAIAVMETRDNKDVTLSDVHRHLEGRLSRTKWPRRSICVGELPRNAMGKVTKAVLRRRFGPGTD